MENRLKLHQALLAILGTENVYFQPPENVHLTYPCIVYARAQVDSKFADNNPYSRTKRYTVTIIDRDPDSPLPDAVGGLPGSSFVTHFTKDNLNHDIYNIQTQSF